MNDYSPPYTVGDNAGTLRFLAPTVVLDGTILGLATNGLQQVLASDPTNSAGNKSALGYIEALGGKLYVGNAVSASDPDTADFQAQSIVISPQTSPILPATFQPTDSLPSSLFSTISGVTVSKSILPAATLTNAGLSTLSLAANTTITVEPGAQVTLNPGGSFQAIARRIENYGGITARGGNISLSLQTNVTTNPIPDQSGQPDQYELHPSQRGDLPG